VKIYDITPTISEELTAFPGDPPVRIDPVTRVSRGEMANVSSITLSTHAGTHIDPTRHLDDRGMPVDSLPLSTLIGETLLIEVPGIGPISRSVLESFSLAGEERLIIKTGNSLLWSEPGFCEVFSHLTLDAAEYLVELGVRLVGIDYLSVEHFCGDGSVHRTLLEKGVVIIEGLKLDEVPAGRYELLCLPLKIKNGDGAPARAVLVSR
jgi:arylformamidase